jgi:hypothetical protein
MEINDFVKFVEGIQKEKFIFSLIGIICFICPGTMFLLFFFKDLFLSFDTFKLLLIIVSFSSFPVIVDSIAIFITTKIILCLVFKKLNFEFKLEQFLPVCFFVGTLSFFLLFSTILLIFLLRRETLDVFVFMWRLFWVQAGVLTGFLFGDIAGGMTFYFINKKK